MEDLIDGIDDPFLDVLGVDADHRVVEYPGGGLIVFVGEV